MEKERISLRAIEREYHVARHYTGPAVRSGELPAIKLGRKKLLVLRADFEAWLARRAVVPDRRAS